MPKYEGQKKNSFLSIPEVGEKQKAQKEKRKEEKEEEKVGEKNGQLCFATTGGARKQARNKNTWVTRVMEFLFKYSIFVI